MALTKVDISLMDNTGTTANKLLAYDGSGNLPAVDGSQLTNVSTATSSASDPTVSTNPSGGVGTEWHNTTSGEVYICTDATAGANVWTNVGAGSGDIVPWPSYTFQAENYGFGVGGYISAASNIIDKFSISAGGTATDHGDLYEAGYYPACYNAEAYGFCHVSYNSANAISPNVNKFSFSSNTTGSDHCDLSTTRGWVSASYNETHGYSSGGRHSSSPQSNVIDKFAFNSTSTATDWGDIGASIYSNDGSSSATHGFHASGYDGSSQTQAIYKYSFSSNAGSSGHGSITNVGKNGSAGASDQSGGYGFIMGGNGGGNGYRTDIDKFAFASNSTASDHGSLSGAGRYGMGGISGASHGFCVAGYASGGSVQIIDKFAYSSNTTAADVGDLSVARSSNSAAGY